MPRMPVLIIHQLSMRNVPIKVMLSMDISLSVIYTKAKFACKQKNLYWSKVDSDFDIKMIENKSMVLHFQPNLFWILVFYVYVVIGQPLCTVQYT